MPKHAHCMLAWSLELAAYEWRKSGQIYPVPAGDDWLRWLEEHRSFAFQGRNGRLNLLKERRKAGPGYWYAYRRHGGSVAKRYVGRSSELTVARLEELAQALNGGSEQAGVSQPRAKATAGVGETLVAPSEPLLAPKFQPPRLHRLLVRRERLLAMLHAGRERKLTVLSAPAGFGKTTLVRQWLAELAERGNAPAVAWLALDHGDNDPLRFWRYVLSACRAFGSGVGAQSLALLEAPLSIKSPLEMALTAFANELAQLQHEGILVLEDYHAITTPQIHEAVGLLLDHLPPHIHLFIVTRIYPPLPLAKLAAAGELSEIEAPDLRFSHAETATFLRQATALTTQPNTLALVESRIEGWAAGLRLLALALESRPDASEISRILENFFGGRRGIGEYFVAEVLDTQPAPVQLFLLQTSFLVRLSASLCDSVTERASSQVLLEALEQANLFLEPLDGTGVWYRYHALFANAMQVEARRRFGDAAVRGLLDRAGRWYEAHGLLTEAIEVAIAANNPQRAADLIEVVYKPQFSLDHAELHGSPEFHTLQHWMTQLPPNVVDEHPLLNLTLAVAILFTHIAEMQPLNGVMGGEIEQLLLRAEHGFEMAGETARLGQVFTFRAMLFNQRDEIATAVGWAKAALETLPPNDLSWRSLCIGTLGTGEQAAGRLETAGGMFAEAQAMCERLNNRPFARAYTVMLGWVLLEQNNLYRAAALFRQVLAEARAVGDLDDTARVLYGLAEIAFSSNDFEAAWSQAEESVTITQQYPHQHEHVYAGLILARVEHARGQHQAALDRCAALLREREPVFLPAEKQLVAQISFEQARMALSAGDLGAAQHWRNTRTTNRELPCVQRNREELLLARLLMAEGNPRDAVQRLEPLLAAAEADQRERVALEIRVALALAYGALGQSQNARQTLAAALSGAQPANDRQVFIIEGEPLAALLRASLPMLGDTNVLSFAKTMLRSATPRDGTAIADLLSPQERRVLHLIAAGRTNPQIAAELIVSVNTVKAHVSSIYRKLNVNSRREALDAARERGL